MNTSTILKPAAGKKAAATNSMTDAIRLEQVLNALAEVDQKLEAVYDAVEPRSSLEILLDLIAHDLLVEAVQPLRGTVLTKGAIVGAHGALFSPLAALEAAIALAGGTAFQRDLIGAHQLLEWAHNELYSAKSVTRALPGGALNRTRLSTSVRGVPA